MKIKVKQKAPASIDEPQAVVKAKREIPKFKAKREWVMIVEYRSGLKGDGTTHQKLGFKSDGGFKTACKTANDLARLLGSSLGKDLREINDMTLCRVVGLYAVNAFQDWENTVGKTHDVNKHIRSTIKLSKDTATQERKIAKAKSESPAKSVRVR